MEKMSFSLHLLPSDTEGRHKDMDYQIVEKEACTVIGKSKKVPCRDGEQMRQISMFWEECLRNGTTAKLGSISTDENLLGICLDIQPDHEDFTYMIASRTDLTTSLEGYSLRTIPASTWAIFTSVGPIPSAIQNVFGRIFQEWFPASGYEHAEAPMLEVYPPGDTTADDYRCEVWIPIVKK
jgi:AraC family transcriptional regulator